MTRPPIPRTLAITGFGEGTPVALAGFVEALVDAGVEALQVREKKLDDRALYELARRVVTLAAGRMLVLVNGRADIALAAGADGVHLPAEGLPAAPLRRRCGPAFLIGRSAHTVEEVAAARGEGCDYAFFGPLRPTPSKPGPTAVPGISGLAAACRGGLPLLALGGIETAADVALAAEAGAAGVAGIRAFADRDGAAAIAAAARLAWPRERA